MRPAENMEKLIKKLRYDAGAETHDRILGNVLQALDATEKQKSGATAPNIRRTIMKSPITKLAAAAVIVVAALIVVSQIGGSGVALADVLAKVEQARAFMYRMKMVMTGSIVPGQTGTDMDGTITISADYGMKWEMLMTDPNSGEWLTTLMYIIPDQGMAVTLVPEKKQYMRMEFGDEWLVQMKKQNYDPREMIKQIIDCEYTELAPSVVDGRRVQGFETTDPAVLGGVGGDGDVKYTLWVDAQNWLPVRSEMDFQIGDQMHVHAVTCDFKWDIPVTAADFEPVIPEDYTTLPMDGMKMPSMSEEGAIKGLKFFAEITGRYPKSLNMIDLAQEMVALRDSPHLRQLIQEMGDQAKQADEADKDRLRDELMKKSMEMMQSIQSPAMFYMMLVQGKKDPAYYGRKVTPEFPHAVLLRWKIEAGNYRVIFADLSVAEVTADELAELEAAPLNTEPTAIRPQPADGAAANALAEVELSWMPGAFVNEHKVYFGSATDELSLLAEFTDSCSVMAPALERATTYYWCVDEVQPDGSIAAGDVWSFNTGKLVGWWKLDGDANDSSSNGNHGTVNGDPNWVIGRIGGALQFDGVDDCVQTDYATDLPVWTVSIWVNSPAAPSSAVPAGPVHRENNFQINWNHSSADFRGAAGLRVGDKWYAASFGELEANKWYHLAATYDGENLKAYKNGVLITDNPDPSGAPDREWATLKLARHSIHGDYFEGTIDDVRIYSYDLSADEVAAIYAAQAEEK